MGGLWRKQKRATKENGNGKSGWAVCVEREVDGSIRDCWI